MLLEVGPCRVDAEGRGTLRNPYSWTRKSSMIFVDQPVGTGLSYADPGVELPTTSSVGAKDLYIFLQIFLTEVFPERRQVPFHIAGESYAVRPRTPDLDLLEADIWNRDTTFRRCLQRYYSKTETMGSQRFP